MTVDSMKPLRRSFASTVSLLFAAALTGCPVTSIPPSQPPFQALSQPVIESVTGTYTHAGSKMTFPTEAAGFARGQVVRFDAAALDVGVGYNLADPKCGAAVTVYVSPAPQHTYVMADPAVVESTQAGYLKQYFEVNKAEISKQRSGARLLSEGAGSLRNPIDRTGLKALYAFTGTFASRSQPLHSELHVFIMDKAWFVKYRATYPESCGSTSSQRVTALMSALPWP